MTTSRPYIVTAQSGPVRLVTAASQAQALRHVAKDDYAVEAASANDILRLIRDGVVAETANVEKETT